MDQFVPEDIPKGSSLLASLQKYLQTHVEYAESQGQYRTADNIHKVSEHLANFELQAKSVDELLIEILEALNFRRNRSNRFAMEKRMLMSLEEDFEKAYKSKMEKTRMLSHYIDVVRNGVGSTQNRTITRKLSAMKRIVLTPDALCKHLHKKQSPPRKLLNMYNQVRGTLMSYSYHTLKSRDVIRELNLGPLMAISERRFKRQQEALKAQKEGRVIESVKDEEDDDEGRLIQPLNFAAIQRSLIYEFRSRNGILYVNAIYKKNFIIDKFHFSVSRLFQEKIAGNAVYYPRQHYGV